ncbi:hypothetical protein EVAR_99159_1 [Eumeta japonica]|uniref:Uncharacterized protein n=1 Tax=Eumeta variegata TaxID=151549 RepID=A0A4C1YGV0_EUMVA|nr:hypothetical protein EVAR_99159_1 [Eumeta japonica]
MRTHKDRRFVIGLVPLRIRKLLLKKGVLKIVFETRNSRKRYRPRYWRCRRAISLSGYLVQSTKVFDRNGCGRPSCFLSLSGCVVGKTGYCRKSNSDENII